MTDLREKIIMRKQASTLIEEAISLRQRHLSTSSQLSGSGSVQDKRRSSASFDGRENLNDEHTWYQRKEFHTPAQEVVDCERSWGGATEKRRKLSYSEESRDSVPAFGRRSEFTPSISGFPMVEKEPTRLGFSHKLRFHTSDKDIDIRNDPEFKFGNNRKNVDASHNEPKEKKEVTNKVSEQIDLEGCEKIYQMAKEIKIRQEEFKMNQDENQNLQWKLKDAEAIVIDVQKKIRTKKDVLKHVEGELRCSKRKIETDEVLIKDLVFENGNKRDIIDGLEKENKDLKKTKAKLLGENAQIRLLAKEISDDSDNLLKVITELKAEKKIADEKIEILLESQKVKKEQANKTNHEEAIQDEGSTNENVVQEEVNEIPGNSEQEATEHQEENLSQALLPPVTAKNS